MSSRARLAVVVALLVAVVGASAVVAKSRRPDPDKHYASRDIRLHLPKPKDETGWTQIKEYDPEKEKNIVLKLIYKKPGSPDHFDVNVVTEGFDHGMNLRIKKHDGTEVEVSTASVQQIAEIIAENIEKNYKDIKEIEKLRKSRISRTVKKGYVFQITGLPEHGTPLHQRLYAFSENGKTYLMQVVMTTTSSKDEKTVDAWEDMLKGMIAWKP